MLQSASPAATERPIKLAAYALGAALMATAIGAAVMPQAAHFHAKGPANTGHSDLACIDCHKEAPGTVRQQLQAKVRFWLGLRATDVAFGHLRVDNARCTDCHAREQDAHPVHRFLEPRFAEARAEIGVESCVSCHREHKGVRVTMAPTACATCHQNLDLKRDPLDVPHRELVAGKEWDTCLGCHDFHGNHKRVAQTRLGDAHPNQAIIDYLNGGLSPYGRDFKYPAQAKPGEH
jgi:hypothetical protein